MSQYVEKDTAYFNWNRSQDISPYLPRTADRICEIGCATGSTLASLKRRYDASFAAGFDIDEQSIAIARGHLDRAEVIDMEATQLPNYINRPLPLPGCARTPEGSLDCSENIARSDEGWWFHCGKHSQCSTLFR